MAEPPGDDVLVVPPIPLASGSMLEPEGDGPPVQHGGGAVGDGRQDRGEGRAVGGGVL